MEALREQGPSSYLMKLEGFSEVRLSHQPYESAVFDVSGHKWGLLTKKNIIRRLIFYPAGKNRDDGKEDHVSLYARIEDVTASQMLMDNWEVNVELKFFIYKHLVKKYSVFQDGIVKCYNKANKEWGFAQMLPSLKFNDPKNGYINGDACTVGVDIFVVKPIEKVERIIFTQNPPNNKFTWKITHFSNIGDTKHYFSDEFVVGDRKWTLKIIPKGDKKIRALSVYVKAMAYLPNAVVSNTYAKLKLRLLNQKNSNHVEEPPFSYLYPGENDGWGFSAFIAVKDLHDESKGYLVEDTIVLEVTFICVSLSKLIDSI